MPIYEYCCKACEHITEKERRIEDRHQPVLCEKCQKETELIISQQGGFALVGGCWGKDGYRK